MKKNLDITKLRYGEQSLPVPWPFSCILFPDKLWRHGGHIVYNITRRRPCRCTKKNHVGVDTYKLKHYLGFESLQNERQYKDISMSPVVYMRMQTFK